MYSTTDFKRGLRIEMDNEPFEIVEFQHVKPGKGGAFVRTKLKNLSTGRVIDRTFRAGEKVETPNIEEKSMQFLYAQAGDYIFMDNETYDQVHIVKDAIGDSAGFLLENISVNILYYNNKPINVEVPNFINLKVVKTEPGIRGDTVSGSTKSAVLETNIVINVPLFINEGDTIKVDTRTKTYIERVPK